MVSFTLHSFLRGIYYYSLTFYAAVVVVITPFINPLLQWRAKSPPTIFKTRYIHECDKKKSRKQLEKEWAEPWALSELKIQQRSLKARDGVEIIYYVVYPPKDGKYKKVMAFCNGLGIHSNLVNFAPLIHRYGKEDGDYSFITWDYRGLFESKSKGTRLRHLAIPNHCEDLREILLIESITSSIILVGHSMGVQVALEMAALYPEQIDKLVLFNGTYGRVFDTAFQPFCRLPFISGLLYRLIDLYLIYPKYLVKTCKLLQALMPWPVSLYDYFFSSKYLTIFLGSKHYLYKFCEDYISNIYSTPTHLRNYLYLFLELDAHCVYHLLRTIKIRTLIISGLLDMLTPAYQSFEMARLLPNCYHLVCPFAAHASCLEQPEKVLVEVIKLLENNEDKKFTNENK